MWVLNYLLTWMQTCDLCFGWAYQYGGAKLERKNTATPNVYNSYRTKNVMDLKPKLVQETTLLNLSYYFGAIQK